MKNILTYLLTVFTLISCEAQVNSPSFWGGDRKEISPCYNYRVVIRGGDPSFLLSSYIHFINCYGQEDFINLSQTGSTQTVYMCASSMLTTVSTPIDPFYSSITNVGNCGETPEEPLPIIPCGQSASYNGGQAFPAVQSIQIGSATGTISVQFDPQGIPDKMIIKRQNGDVLLNTGYRTNYSSGSSGFNQEQQRLNSALNSRGLPNESLASSPSNLTYTFNKNFSDSNIIVEIYAPAASTGWEFKVNCP